MLFPLLSMTACKAPTQAPSEDADGDGFVEDDCDDTNPYVHPGAMDLWNDGLDADCDGEDRKLYRPEDLHLRLERDWTFFEICDLTDDGQDDLLIGKLERNDRIWHVMEGPLSPGTIVPRDAIAILDLPHRDVECADFTGDGRADLVFVGRNPDDGLTSVSILPQPPGGFIGAVDREGVREYPIDEPGVFAEETMEFPDIDGDGVHDLLFRRYQPGTLTTPQLRFEDYVLGGDHVPQPFLELAQPLDLDLDVDFITRHFLDLDGDSEPELVTCARDLCRVFQGYPLDGSPSDPYVLGGFAAPGIASAGELATGDFDGDGIRDDLVVAGWEGGLVFYRDVMENLTARGAITPRAPVPTTPSYQSIENLGDIDGDGADDVVSTIGFGSIERVVSGRVGMAGVALGADEALASLFQVQRAGAVFGEHVVGDLDGDGTMDVGWALPSFEEEEEAYLGVQLTGRIATGTPVAASVEIEGGCDYTQILGTWTRSGPSPFGEATNTLVFDVPGPLQPGQAAGQLVIGFEEADPCVFALECSPTDSGRRTWARLVQHHPSLVCASGWTDWALQFDGTLQEALSTKAPGGEALTLSFYEPVAP